jgi:predicted metal-dependent HD superfamily phosphohydrolase
VSGTVVPPKGRVAPAIARDAEERWTETGSLMGHQLGEDLLAELVARYAEPHRAYHNLGHVLDCLQEAKTVRDQLDSPAAAELALWYHDAIYDPHRADNEERSAAMASERLAALPGALQSRVVGLVLATKHDAPPTSLDQALIVDIDLSIFGASEARFEAYDAAIRREYRWVPGPLYRRKRREVLQSFLDRPQIFATDHFATRLEVQARANLARAVARLS